MLIIKFPSALYTLIIVNTDTSHTHIYYIYSLYYIYNMILLFRIEVTNVVQELDAVAELVKFRRPVRKVGTLISNKQWTYKFDTCHFIALW